MRKTCHTRGFTAALTVSAHLRPGVCHHQVERNIFRSVYRYCNIVTAVDLNAITSNMNLCVFAKIAKHLSRSKFWWKFCQECAMYHIMHTYPIFFFCLQKTLISISMILSYIWCAGYCCFSQDLSEGHLFSFPSLVLVVT